MTESKSRLTAKDLFEPLLYVLGKHTGFDPQISVPHEALMNEVLEAAGIDPTSSVLTGRDGLYRRVHFAWRNQCKGYTGVSRVPYCTKGAQRGHWGLTEAGASRARELVSVFEEDPSEDIVTILNQEALRLSIEAVDLAPEAPRAPAESRPQPKTSRNQTARWIEEKGPKLMARLRQHLSLKMPRSLVMDKVDDHIQTFLTNLIRRDALARYIAEGKSIPLSRVCAWCRRSAYSDIRDEGRDPVTRTLHGALTRDEWTQRNESNWTTEVVPSTINQSDRLSLGSSYGMGSYDPEAQGVNAMDFLVADSDVEVEVADSEAFEHTYDIVAQAISDALRGKEHDAALHHQILMDRFVKRLTVAELAEKHNIPKETATAVVGRIRKVVRKARDQGAFSEVLRD